MAAISQNIKKAELHCHLDGVINPSILEESAKREQIENVHSEALKNIIPVKSMEQWINSYQKLIAQYLVPPDRINSCFEIHIENLIRQHVVYAEIMVSGLLLQPEGVGKVIERFTNLRNIADRLEAQAIQLELLVAIGRGPLERAEKQAKNILALQKEGLISGVAIAGDESACTIESLANVLGKFRDVGLGLEIHTGELAGPESVWDAMIHGRPDRIGHGVRAFEDGRLIDELQRKNVHIEFCLTSNICLGVISNIKQHPIARAKQLGLNFSVNTDDPGPFGCSLESEFQLLENTFGFNQQDFEKIYLDSMRSRFGKRQVMP